jgi:cyclopropane fatty-acyl-phospholipid synthase-like methyltransferase
VITGDVLTYNFEPETFDRVISIELFEQMKTHQLLLARVAKALKPQGKLFVHIFAHKELLYDFGDGDEHALLHGRNDALCGPAAFLPRRPHLTAAVVDFW